MTRSFPFRARDGRAGVVRPAQPPDARACLAIVAEAARERPRTLAIIEDELWTIREWKRHRLDWSHRGVWLVAEFDGAVVGQLSCERSNRSVTAHNADLGITVAGAARRRGIGRALMLALEAWAHDVGVERLTLGVFTGNEAAIDLYRSLGYVEEGIERGVVRFPEADIDVIRMAKRVERAPRARDYDEATDERG
jgi:RimJ/RimL family protein N-acetyltransferase